MVLLFTPVFWVKKCSIIHIPVANIQNDTIIEEQKQLLSRNFMIKIEKNEKRSMVKNSRNLLYYIFFP